MPNGQFGEAGHCVGIVRLEFKRALEAPARRRQLADVERGPAKIEVGRGKLRSDLGFGRERRDGFVPPVELGKAQAQRIEDCRILWRERMRLAQIRERQLWLLLGLEPIGTQIKQKRMHHALVEAGPCQIDRARHVGRLQCPFDRGNHVRLGGQVAVQGLGPSRGIRCRV